MFEQQTRILLAEDDYSLALMMKDVLEDAGYAVVHCIDGGGLYPNQNLVILGDRFVHISQFQYFRRPVSGVHNGFHRSAPSDRGCQLNVRQPAPTRFCPSPRGRGQAYDAATA